ncbi:hypothetical protein ACFXOI_29785 [Streptomyces bacillaris]|uniref:hypothetical protein n=1 Tax=Streptomyces TaxID=1883 RepID=UPI00200DC350|nr:hypothetical protein [Streptomyces sp. HNA39]
MRTETPVGVMLERDLELVVALLAVLEAGGAFVPVDRRSHHLGAGDLREQDEQPVPVHVLVLRQQDPDSGDRLRFRRRAGPALSGPARRDLSRGCYPSGRLCRPSMNPGICSNARSKKPKSSLLQDQLAENRQWIPRRRPARFRRGRLPARRALLPGVFPGRYTRHFGSDSRVPRWVLDIACKEVAHSRFISPIREPARLDMGHRYYFVNGGLLM